MDGKHCKHCGGGIEEHQKHCFACSLLSRIFRHTNPDEEGRRAGSRIMGEWLWVAGAGLIVGSITKTTIPRYKLFGAGLIVLLIGVFLKARTNNI